MIAVSIRPSVVRKARVWQDVDPREAVHGSGQRARETLVLFSSFCS